MKEALAKKDADDKLKAAQKDAEDKLKAAKVQLNAEKKDADDKLKAAMVQLDSISKSRAATVAARTRVAAQLATDPPPCPKRQRTAAAAASNTFTMAGRKRRAVRQITKDDMDDDDGEALTLGTWERADAVRPRALSHHTVTGLSQLAHAKGRSPTLGRAQSVLAARKIRNFKRPERAGAPGPTPLPANPFAGVCSSGPGAMPCPAGPRSSVDPHGSTA
jgi:hypothetical protein